MDDETMEGTPEKRVWQSLGRAVVSAIEPRGSLEIFIPSRTLYVTRGSGVLSHAMALQWIAALDPMLAKGARMSCFHEWSAVLDYEVAARHVIGRWTIRRASRCVEIKILTTSPVIPLAVRALNVATKLGGLEMEAMSDRARFYDALIERVGALSPRAEP